MSVDVQTRLNSFLRSVLEWRGGVVEWPEHAEAGEALLPEDVAASLDCPEVATLAYQPGAGDLVADLATDFVDRIEVLFETKSRVGMCRVPGLYLKQSAMEAPMARAFTWLNARVRLRSTVATRIEYHVWHFHAALRSEDQWEDVLSITLNSQSQVEIHMPDLEALGSVEPSEEPVTSPPNTYRSASRRALAHLETRSSDFVARLESRLKRDRRRLKDYYHALAHQAKQKAARSRTEQSAQKQEEQSRAVQLELRRKLLELTERYAVSGELTPLTLNRVELPVLALECEVTRKRARRTHTAYWNPVLKTLEPLRCHRCGEGTFVVAFTDKAVDATCPRCNEGQ